MFFTTLIDTDPEIYKYIIMLSVRQFSAYYKKLDIFSKYFTDRINSTS